MDVRSLGLEGVLELHPKRHEDSRGFFSETWSSAAQAAAGIGTTWPQDNHSHSLLPFTLRGLHFQAPPVAQAKLLRVSRGAIFDVVVDLRRSSQTYGRWISLIISAAEWNQIFIPEGFAHGYLTLEPSTDVIYKASTLFAPAQARSIRWDDPALDIDWPLAGMTPIVSASDQAAPLLRDIETGF